MYVCGSSEVDVVNQLHHLHAFARQSYTTAVTGPIAIDQREGNTHDTGALQF